MGALGALALRPAQLNSILPDLRVAVASEEANTRGAAIGALGALGGPEGQQALRQIAGQYPAEALAQFGPAGIPVAEILPYVTSTVPDIRLAAIGTLGRAKDAAAAETALWSLLEKESDSNIRVQIVNSIGGVGTRDTVQRLQAWLASHPEDRSLPIEIAKETILRRLIGQ